MRINEGFELRELCGEHIVIGTGVANVDFSKVVSLNESAVYLWRKVEGREFTSAELADLLVAKYEIDQDTALTDATSLAERWVEVGIVSR